MAAEKNGGILRRRWSNNVQDIQEDKQGNIWFGTRVAENDHPDPIGRTGNGGLCRYDGKKCTQFPDLEGLSRNEIYSIYQDRAGNIWIGATRVGVYRYDGQSFQIFRGTDRMDLTANFGVQDILEDRNGTIWFGFSGGLFRLSGSSIVNVTQHGPWK
ncbi:MAG: two-component regulator propeller domain-containing protein [Saprospiraceae bacterium]